MGIVARNVCQFSLVLYLRELALFINEGDDVHGFVGDHVQGVLVVCELDVLPADVLQVVLLLLQFEDVADEELLQVLVGEVDAQLFETTVRKAGSRCECTGLNWRKRHCLTIKTRVQTRFFCQINGPILTVNDQV